MSDASPQIHEEVRRRYGKIAREFQPSGGSSCCCGPSLDAAGCGCSPSLYADGMLEELPFDVTGLSLGCGDPISIARLQPGETVLDLGSGGGIDCFLAARQVGPQGKVIGVDATPEMLAKANANRERMNVTNVEFREGHIENLPVADASVDVVISNCVVNLSPDKPAAFGEAFRVLRPGGRVSISDIVTEGEFTPELRAQLDLWSACISGAWSLTDYLDALRRVGFEDVRVEEQVETHVPELAGIKAPRVFSARVVARKPA